MFFKVQCVCKPGREIQLCWRKRLMPSLAHQCQRSHPSATGTVRVSTPLIFSFKPFKLLVWTDLVCFAFNILGSAHANHCTSRSRLVPAPTCCWQSFPVWASLAFRSRVCTPWPGPRWDTSCLTFTPLPRMALLYLENITVLKGECKKSNSGKISSAYWISLCEHNYFFSMEGL